MRNVGQEENRDAYLFCENQIDLGTLLDGRPRRRDGKDSTGEQRKEGKGYGEEEHGGREGDRSSTRAKAARCQRQGRQGVRTYPEQPVAPAVRTQRR